MYFRTMSVIVAAFLLFNSGVYAEDDEQSEVKLKTSEAEKGYVSADIQKGWAYGQDGVAHEIAPEQMTVKKTKREANVILEEILLVQKEQLKEQKKIREILEEQFDPKPKTITRKDGTKCIANSSSDCFDFPLIAEAKRIPVMANHLKNPHDAKATAEWKKWYATYLNHNFDIGKAWEYDSAENGSKTFQTDFKRDGYDSARGYFYTAKDKHNSRLLNAFGSRGLSMRIYLGKTQDLDIYAMDQIAMFIQKHPSLPIELMFANKTSAEVYAGGARALDFVGAALSQSNVSKKISTESEFPKNLQSTPTYSVSYADGKNNKSKIIKSGKVEASRLANAVVEWMIFEKLIDPAQLSDSRVWGDIEGYGSDFIEETYGKKLFGGRTK